MVYDMLIDSASADGDAIVDDRRRQMARTAPLQHCQRSERPKGFLADANANVLVMAGGCVGGHQGYFIAPKSTRHFADGNRLTREDQRGSRLPLHAYDDFDEAVASANDTESGIGSAVWTSNARGLDFTRTVDSDTVCVSKHRDLRFAGS